MIDASPVAMVISILHPPFAPPSANMCFTFILAVHIAGNEPVCLWRRIHILQHVPCPVDRTTARTPSTPASFSITPHFWSSEFSAPFLSLLCARPLSHVACVLSLRVTQDVF
jgi:hypothetical protein